MNRVRARHLVLLTGTALLLGGCTAGTGDQAGPATSTATTTPTSATPGTTVSLRAECLDVANKAQALLATVGRLASGDGTLEQVRTSAGALSDSFDAARASLGSQARADLAAAEQALRRVGDALSTRPVDTEALRRAASEFVTALGDAAVVCAPGASTTGSVSGTETGTESVTEPVPTS